MIVEKCACFLRRPHGCICTKFGIAGCLVDLIARDSFWLGFGSVRSRILPFLYLQLVAINTMLAVSRQPVILLHAYQLGFTQLLAAVSTAGKEILHSAYWYVQVACDCFRT